MIPAALIVAWCGAVVGQSQQPPRDTRPPTAASSAASISGTVTSDETHPRKLRRVLVALNGDGLADGGRTVVTDDEGRFRFDALPPGQYGLMATKDGYVSARYGSSRPPRYLNYLLLARTGISVHAGENATADIRLARGAVITGIVTDTEGRPEQDVLVTASWYVPSVPSGARRLMPAAGPHVTDDRGLYRIFGLPAGEYLVAAEGPSVIAQPSIRLSSTDSRSLLVAPVYFPSTTDSSEATRIKLGAGEERDGIDIQMRYVPMATVSGLATIPSGSTSGRVWLTRAAVSPSDLPGATNAREASLAADGAFTFPGIAPGHYVLYAIANGPSPGGGQMDATLAAGSVPVDVGGDDVSSVAIPMSPTFSISGTLVFEGATRPSVRFGSMTVQITPIGTPFNSTAYFQPSDESHFTISGLIPGAYRLTNATQFGFRPPVMGRWWPKSIVVGGREVLDQPLDALRPTDDVVVTFSDRASIVSGIVHDTQGLPLHDVFVTIFGADRSSWFPNSRRVATVHTDAQGRYRVSNLPPGDYRAAVSLDLEPAEFFEPDVLQALLPNAVPFTITGVETKTLDLILR